MKARPRPGPHSRSRFEPPPVLPPCAAAPGYTHQVIGPRLAHRVRRVHLKRAGFHGGGKFPSAGGARHDGGAHPERQGKHRSPVIIGMLPDQIHPSGSGGRDGRAGKVARAKEVRRGGIGGRHDRAISHHFHTELQPLTTESQISQRFTELLSVWIITQHPEKVAIAKSLVFIFISATVRRRSGPKILPEARH